MGLAVGAAACRRASGASSTPRSTASRPRRSIPFYTAAIREFHAAGRPVVGSGPVGVDGTAAWLEAIGKAAGVAAEQDRRRQDRGPAGDPRRRSPPTRSRRRVTRLGLRGLGAAGRPPADRGRRRGALCRHRLPAHRVERPRPRVARGPRRRTSSTAPRSSRTSRRCATSEPDLAHRHDAAGAEGQGAGHPGALLHQPGLRPAAVRAGRRRRRWPGSSPRQTQGPRALRPDGRVLRGVGKGDAAGYGWTGVPTDHPAFQARATARRRVRRRRSPTRWGA